jgi:hypothetical protein
LELAKLTQLTRKQLLLGAASLALLVTPYLACSSSSDTAPASESAEAQQARLLGTWQGTAELDGETIPFSLTLDRQARQISAERVAVVGAITSENPNFDGVVDGNVGSSDKGVTLSLRLSDGKVLLGTLEGEAIGDGRILRAAQSGTFGLTRP